MTDDLQHMRIRRIAGHPIPKEMFQNIEAEIRRAKPKNGAAEKGFQGADSERG